MLLVDGPTPTWEHDVKVEDTLKINMHLLCKGLGCGAQYSMYNTKGVYKKISSESLAYKTYIWDEHLSTQCCIDK